MLDKFKKLLGIPPMPTQEEVWEALDGEKWRTKERIRELIDQTRLSAGKATLEEKGWVLVTLGFVRHKIEDILFWFRKDGVVERIYCNQLSLEEIAMSDDERISSPSKIFELRKSRRGISQAVYRRGKGKRIGGDNESRIAIPEGIMSKA